MPPLSPPPECAEHMEQRADDTEPVIRRRLEVYKAAAAPVEAYYSGRGKLLNFEITGAAGAGAGIVGTGCWAGAVGPAGAPPPPPSC